MIETFALYNADSGQGLLRVIESTLPFDSIRRVFTISEVPRGTIRGGHAHKTCGQFLFSAAGTFMLHSVARDGIKQHQQLSPQGIGVYVPPMHWITLDKFTKHAVCVVLCSDFFDELDYIRNYDEFQNLCKS